MRPDNPAPGLRYEIECPDGTKVYNEWKQKVLHICLDTKLKETDIELLNLSKDAVFICRDVALNDTLAANLALQCRLKTI
ncbi:MAG: hypothetical protein OXG88_10955 [Gammaproteobacteria bacterium]|nr:hypothetical protein [Gammaproteobacteria bacterium]